MRQSLLRIDIRTTCVAWENGANVQVGRESQRNHFQKFGFCSRRRSKFWNQVVSVDSGTNVSEGLGVIWFCVTAKLDTKL